MASKKTATRKKASDEVSITLAHPLRAQYAERLGLEAKDYDTEDTIKVRRDNAQSIINAGYAADIDPDDQEAVEGLLGSASDGAQTSTSGNK